MTDYIIFGYNATTADSSPGSPTISVTVPPSQTSVLITGLAHDCYTTYSFSVQAQSASGDSPPATTGPYLASGWPPSTPPATTVILLDGAPSSESGGTFYPLHVASPSTGVGTVYNYCPTTTSNKMNSFPAGLQDNLRRWSEFPGGGGTSGSACLDTNVPINCLTAALAGKDQAVLLPFSYTGATLATSATGDQFNMPSYNACDSAGGPQCVSGGQPDDQRSALDAEITSIHTIWPSTQIVLIGHSYGGMLAEQWWQLFRPNYSDHDGVTHVYSLDSPINGIRNALVAPYSQQIENLWFDLWNNLFTNGQNDLDILSADADGSYRAIGTPDDGTYGSLANGPNPPITSQLDFTTDGQGDLFETSVDFQSPCSAQVAIAGTVYGHDTPKVCPDVVSGISGAIQPSSNLVVNGSFEENTFSFDGTLDLGGSTPLTGWTTLSNGTYPWGLPYPNVYNAGPTPYGNQWVIVGNYYNGGTWVEQTVTGLTPGHTYNLNLATASEQTGGQYSALLGVSFPSGSSTADQTIDAPPAQVNFWDTWAMSSVPFVASDSSVTFRLTGLAGPGGDPGIDNVSITG